jgi:hypothetical protein
MNMPGCVRPDQPYGFTSSNILALLFSSPYICL